MHLAGRGKNGNKAPGSRFDGRPTGAYGAGDILRTSAAGRQTAVSPPLRGKTSTPRMNPPALLIAQRNLPFKPGRSSEVLDDRTRQRRRPVPASSLRREKPPFKTLWETQVRAILLKPALR